MAEIVSFRPSEHETVQRLLPWLVNGTLAPAEAARVEEHLLACEACREDLALERKLAREIALLPLGVDEGWQAVSLRLGEQGAGNDNGRVPLWRRPVAAGWAAGGAVAAALLLTFAATGLPSPTREAGPFHTLGSAAAAPDGRVVVLFRPDTSAQQMRTILSAEGARVVDGPTAAGAYVLRIDDRSPADAINGLRQSSEVVLAEPIANDGRP